MVRSDVSNSEMTIILGIVERAWRLNAVKSGCLLALHIMACHTNGCPLDLEGLKDAPDSDFSHDVLGIMAHLDLETGQLRDCFWPRSAKREEDSDDQ